MRRICCMSVLVVLILLSGCKQGAEETGAESEPDEAPLTAATLGEQSVLTPTEYLAQPVYAAADREQGRKQALLCRACHTFENGGSHMLGPNLSGLFGSKIGTKDGFDYSEAVVEAEFIWTPRALDAWLAQPGRFLPGNKMTFAGVADPGDRADLITYLLEVTGVE